ncbi:MAG TPA: carboxylesterase family protein, partial [Bryobacteraceae bacterium]|nr:carboxylesterase family protein [Bryobacteraceae bacterium]
VQIDTGTISGASTGSPEVQVFKGIPYAAPPVGDLRWRAPKPAARWEGTRKGDEFGPVCMQGGNQKMSEDCLYLNVWTGAKSASEKLPVMVWIYGGGYYTGSGSQPMYDGEALAKKGAVVVTFNYRLGPFGFFSYPELTKESDRRGAANFGVLDSIAALEWVKKNIARFGGDPKHVTIFGESAGAGMVANLLAIPQAKGLFVRAMGESSAWSTATIAPLGTLAEGEAEGVKLADKLGAKSLAELRAAPAEAIQKAGRGQGPVVDGWLITEDPSKVFAAGKQSDVPVLTGSNRDESFGGNPKSAAEFVEQAHKRFGDLADAYLKIYPAGSDEEARESAFYSGRDEMAFIMRNWAHLEEKPGKAKAYVYYFTEQPPRLPNARGPFAPGPHGSATHVSEILYAFGHLDNSRTWTDEDRKVADEMSSYWVNFARSGDPNSKGMAKWPVYDGHEQNVMIFGNVPEGKQAPSEAGLAFFQSYFDKVSAR